MITKDYKGSSEQCSPIEAAVPASSKEPKSTNPPLQNPPKAQFCSDTSLRPRPSY